MGTNLDAFNTQMRQVYCFANREVPLQRPTFGPLCSPFVQRELQTKCKRLTLKIMTVDPLTAKENELKLYKPLLLS